MSGILAGTKIVDLSRILAGPLSTQMLSDLGAEVIKVEAPWGDDTRKWGPPFTTGFDGKPVAAYFLACNRGKQIITMNLKQEKAKLLELLPMLMWLWKISSPVRLSAFLANCQKTSSCVQYQHMAKMAQDEMSLVTTLHYKQEVES